MLFVRSSFEILDNFIDIILTNKKENFLFDVNKTMQETLIKLIYFCIITENTDPFQAEGQIFIYLSNNKIKN